ncbi:MAG TPA: hypothetical protein ENN54_05220 [Thermoplasmatales archaeon]|nr:hypothetical protein [Thermoplasmatales archaeon]
MGRTLPTYRMAMEDVIREWDGFKQALRREDRRLFDQLMQRGRRHASAASYAIRPHPIESLLMSILLEMEKDLDRLGRTRLDAGMDS